MSYVKTIKNVVSLSKDELIEMIEERYGLSNVPNKVEVKVFIDNYHRLVDITKGIDPVQICWESQEKIESFPDGEEVKDE